MQFFLPYLISHVDEINFLGKPSLCVPKQKKAVLKNKNSGTQRAEWKFEI